MANSTIYDNPSFQHILSITEEIIIEKGCRNTTLKDIIERSGLSKGAIYHYVDSKDELFGLILKSKIEEMNEKFQMTITQSMQEESPNQGRFGVVSQFFHSRQNSNDIGNLIFIYLLSQENEKVKNILTELFRYSKDTGTQWIKMGQENGVIPPNIDAERMSTLMMTFSYGLRVTQSLSSSEEDKVDASDIFKVIMNSLT
ncbi:TetR/AcrR family transcriptional regulator [Bacillus sp. ISL-40]|uniref:TetR/AcrR family transcriptional regulator n=1 Tax=unclassified Bacillus (in: firmicutes) TaxID=185979 RepID=UPI001BE61A74|nr:MULTISPECIES: TetR/AcrR family transcriptional regulator [unclassified Bacillus (in: firmicutes)]MBT2699648.1 TetR/AcrR family transcriptional regulator [Bacillus sp. ISL-40]MBT2739629.1 TetR/AcrR family transcriptional regulator [Bacillus sp. ISL-77]